MSNVSILVVKPKTLNRADKDLLREAGVVVVENHEPESVRFLSPSQAITSSDMLYAAIVAITESPGINTAEKFTKTLGTIIKADRKREEDALLAARADKGEV